MGLHKIGVAKVLSTINGIPFLCATFANLSISKTCRLGLVNVSPKIVREIDVYRAPQGFNDINAMKMICEECEQYLY